MLSESDYSDKNLNEDLDLLKQLIIVTNLSAKPVKIVLVKNNLPQINTHHFNNLVIHKLLTPSYIESSSNLQLNLDAGFLIGTKFNDLIRHFLIEFAERNEAFVALLGEDSKHFLPNYFLQKSTLNYYPKGGLLIFDRNQYFGRKANETFYKNYIYYRHTLIYPDQELLAICLDPTEVIRLTELESNPIYIRYLWPDYFVRKREPILSSKDFALYKNAGLLKPWQYFVLDPEKSLYISRRNDLSEKINLDGNVSIENARELIPRKDILIAGCKLYEIQLVNDYLHNAES